MIKTIAVIGAGTMGHGIAGTFAMNGYLVHLYDVSADVREKVKGVISQELVFLAENDALPGGNVQETLDRIAIYGDLKEAVQDADYVIESAPENLGLKQDLFLELDGYCKPECILASNTSTLPLKDMMAKVGAERQTRMMVCHWYNPPHIMPIVELSYFGNMPEDIYQEVAALYQKAGKQLVKVLKDVPGLVANRIQQGVAREVFSIIEQGIAAPEDVDRALKFGPAFRYATTGQLEVADMGGLDIWCVSGDNLLAAIDDRHDSNPLLRQKVAEGKLGLKSGEGFFQYPAEKIPEIKNQFNKKLLIQLKASKSYID